MEVLEVSLVCVKYTQSTRIIERIYSFHCFLMISMPHLIFPFVLLRKWKYHSLSYFYALVINIKDDENGKWIEICLYYSFRGTEEWDIKKIFNYVSTISKFFKQIGRIGRQDTFWAYDHCRQIIKFPSNLIPSGYIEVNVCVSIYLSRSLSLVIDRRWCH